MKSEQPVGGKEENCRWQVIGTERAALIWEVNSAQDLKTKEHPV